MLLERSRCRGKGRAIARDEGHTHPPCLDRRCSDRKNPGESQPCAALLASSRKSNKSCFLLANLLVPNPNLRDQYPLVKNVRS